MKGALSLLFLLTPALAAHAAEQLIPAGSIVQCTISEPKLSSKTTQVGDPVLCQLSPVEMYGRGTVPYGSYLEGRFEDFKDPGHLVGKGWMELRFDRIVIEPSTVIPVAAKVVGVPGYSVDREGRILGKGHAVRDTIEWAVPILWPIDLLNLPRRGPRPTLKGETRLTLKIMDDIGVPAVAEPQRDPSGLYRRAPVTYTPPPQQYVEVPPRPITYVYPPQQPPVYLLPPQPTGPVMILRHGVAYRTIGAQ